MFVDESMTGIAFFMPVLAYLPGHLIRIKRLKSNMSMVVRFAQEFINEHLQNYDEDNIDDFTSAFIREMKKHETTNETTNVTGMYKFEIYKITTKHLNVTIACLHPIS